MQRRRFLVSLAAFGMLPAVAVAQPWYGDYRRRRAYERWREQEIHRREQEARRRHRAWRRSMWHEEREREAWARRQPWYRPY